MSIVNILLIMFIALFWIFIFIHRICKCVEYKALVNFQAAAVREMNDDLKRDILEKNIL